MVPNEGDKKLHKMIVQGLNSPKQVREGFMRVWSYPKIDI